MAKRKANQHYIPRFYLREFATCVGGKKIGVFNTENGFSTTKAPIKSQASKPYFYGKDGILEDHLSHTEGHSSQILNSIKTTSHFPNHSSNDFESLLVFLVLLEMRNPQQVNEIQESMRQMLEIAYSRTDETPDFNSDNLKDLYMSLSLIGPIVDICKDLKGIVLNNTSETPFITSDNPLVKYNQFLEKRKKNGSITGYGAIGIQIIYPLNPKMALLLYDPSVYKLRQKDLQSIEIKSTAEIRDLNLLQFLNCNKIIYFNSDISRDELEFLCKRSKKFQKANIVKTSEHNFKRDGIRNDNYDTIIHTYQSDCKINLKLSFLTLKRKALKTQLDDSLMAHMRHRFNEWEKRHKLH